LAQIHTYQTHTNFKNLNIFVLASGSLLFSGYLLRSEFDWKVFVILFWCNLSGVFLIYRLNDCIDQAADLKFNLSYFFSYRLHQFAVAQFVLVAIPAALFYLNIFTLYVLSGAALIGIIYSLSFKINGKLFRIKNVFLLKNILIGFVWGSIILIGAGNINHGIVFALFLFSSVQVVIGSLIRDVPDLEKDRVSGVKSLPVVLGLKKTFWFMYVVNLISLGIILIYPTKPLIILAIVVVIWRFMNLFFLQKNTTSVLWGQKMNLLTCVLIGVITFMVRFYEFN